MGLVCKNRFRSTRILRTFRNGCWNENYLGHIYERIPPLNSLHLLTKLSPYLAHRLTNQPMHWSPVQNRERPEETAASSGLQSALCSICCIAVHCSAVHCIALHCIALHCIALQWSWSAAEGLLAPHQPYTS